MAGAEWYGIASLIYVLVGKPLARVRMGSLFSIWPFQQADSFTWWLKVLRVAREETFILGTNKSYWALQLPRNLLGFLEVAITQGGSCR